MTVMPTIKKTIHKKSDRRAWYNSTVWRWLRTAHIKREPVCRRCAYFGRTTYKNLVVDHIAPRRLFEKYEVSKDNLTTLCRTCHTYKTNYDNKHRNGESWLDKVESLDYYEAIKDNISRLFGKKR